MGIPSESDASAPRRRRWWLAAGEWWTPRLPPSESTSAIATPATTARVPSTTLFRRALGLSAPAAAALAAASVPPTAPTGRRHDNSSASSHRTADSRELLTMREFLHAKPARPTHALARGASSESLTQAMGDGRRPWMTGAGPAAPPADRPNRPGHPGRDESSGDPSRVPLETSRATSSATAVDSPAETDGNVQGDGAPSGNAPFGNPEAAPPPPPHDRPAPASSSASSSGAPAPKSILWDYLPCREVYLPYLIAAIFFLLGCGISMAVFVPVNAISRTSTEKDLSSICQQFRSVLSLEVQRSVTLLASFSSYVSVLNTSQTSITNEQFFSYGTGLPLNVTHIDRVDYVVEVLDDQRAAWESQYNLTVTWYRSTPTSQFYVAPPDSAPVYYPVQWTLKTTFTNASFANYSGFDYYTISTRREAIDAATMLRSQAITNTSLTSFGEQSFFIVSPVLRDNTPVTGFVSARFSVPNTFASALALFPDVGADQGVLVYSSGSLGEAEVLASNLGMDFSNAKTVSAIRAMQFPYDTQTDTTLPVTNQMWHISCFANYSVPALAITLLIVIFMFTFVFSVLLFSYLQKLFDARARARQQGHQLIVVGKNALAILSAISDPLVIVDRTGKIIDANDLALDLLGYTLADLQSAPHPLRYVDVFLERAAPVVQADAAGNVLLEVGSAPSRLSLRSRRSQQRVSVTAPASAGATGLQRQLSRVSQMSHASAPSAEPTPPPLPPKASLSQNDCPSMADTDMQSTNSGAPRSQTSHMEMLVRRKDGSTLEADVSSSVSIYGKHWLQVVLFRDVSSRLRAARELQIAKLNAERADTQKSEFLGFICHEIRNPIHAINGICEIMLSQPRLSTSEVYDNLRTILDVSNLMHTIVSDVLDLNKIKSGRMLLEALEVDFIDFVRSLVKSQKAVLFQRRPQLAIGGLRLPAAAPSTASSSAAAALGSSSPDQAAGAPAAHGIELAAFFEGWPVSAATVQDLAAREMLRGAAKTTGPESPAPAGFLFPSLVVTDATHLQQIVINLIGNSVKFTLCGQIHLNVRLLDADTEHDSATLGLEIADTGIGFDPTRVAEIVKPYSQATASIGREFGGTGLGLSIVSDLIKLIGQDDMHIATGVSEGTRISFSIRVLVKQWVLLDAARVIVERLDSAAGSPGTTAQAEASSPAASVASSARWRPGDTAVASLPPAAPGAASGHTSPALSGGSLQAYVASVAMLQHAAAGLSAVPDEPERTRVVLVVEDNKINQILAAKMLRNHGFVVRTADDGEHALRVIEQLGPDYFDAVLMDVVMPRMDGKECTRIIRERGWTMPVVACTANAQEADRRDCLARGFSEYLTKPLKQRDLIDVITRVSAPEQPLAAVPPPAAAPVSGIPPPLLLPQSASICSSSAVSSSSSSTPSLA